MTVAELLDRASALELAEWKVYERDTGPIGQQRDDQLAAMTAYYVVSALGAKKAKLSDMVPKWAPKRPQTWQDMKTKLMALTASAGGEVVEKVSE